MKTSIAMLLFVSATLPVVALAEPSAADFLKRADEERAKSKTQEAIEDYDRALTQDPKLGRAYMGRGIARWEQGDAAPATEDFSKVIELDPNNAEAFERRALMESGMKDREGALRDYDKALELDPKRASAYAGRADEYRDAGDLDAALSDYTRAIQIDPYNGTTYFSRSIIFYQKQRWREAAADLRKRLKLMTEEVGYTRLYLWVVRAHMGEQKKGANQELLRYFADTRKKPASLAEGTVDTLKPYPLAYSAEKIRDPARPIPNSRMGEWTEAIAKYLCGKIDEKTLFAADVTPALQPSLFPHARISPLLHHSCDAWYFAGIKALEQRNEAKAAECFENCLKAPWPRPPELTFAQTELNAIAEKAKKDRPPIHE